LDKKTHQAVILNNQQKFCHW